MKKPLLNRKRMRVLTALLRKKHLISFTEAELTSLACLVGDKGKNKRRRINNDYFNRLIGTRTKR